MVPLPETRTAAAVFFKERISDITGFYHRGGLYTSKSFFVNPPNAATNSAAGKNTTKYPTEKYLKTGLRKPEEIIQKNIPEKNLILQQAKHYLLRLLYILQQL